MMLPPLEKVTRLLSGLGFIAGAPRAATEQIQRDIRLDMRVHLK